MVNASSERVCRLLPIFIVAGLACAADAGQLIMRFARHWGTEVR